MLRGAGFGFTHLVEEDDTDNIAAGNGFCHDLEIQPHLSTYNSNAYMTSPVKETVVTSSRSTHVTSPAEEVVVTYNSSNNCVTTPAKEAVTNSSNQTHIEAYSSDSGKQSELSRVSSSQTIKTTDSPEEAAKVHIQYSSTDGKVNVLHGQVVTRSDGSRYIDTKGIHQHWSELEGPLRQHKIKLLKIFSILACIAFFPFGLLALYFAFRTETEFREGIMKGNIDRAQKFVKRTEKLIVISFIMCLVIVALVVAFVVGTNKKGGPLGGPIMG